MRNFAVNSWAEEGASVMRRSTQWLSLGSVVMLGSLQLFREGKGILLILGLLIIVTLPSPT